MCAREHIRTRRIGAACAMVLRFVKSGLNICEIKTHALLYKTKSDVEITTIEKKTTSTTKDFGLI